MLQFPLWLFHQTQNVGIGDSIAAGSLTLKKSSTNPILDVIGTSGSAFFISDKIGVGTTTPNHLLTLNKELLTPTLSATTFIANTADFNAGDFVVTEEGLIGFNKAAPVAQFVCTQSV